MMPRARSSVLAPSLTRMASGRSLIDPAQRAQSAVEVHRRRVAHQLRRHLGDVRFLARIDGVDPVGRREPATAIDAGEKGRHAGADVADHGCHDLDVAVHLLGLDVDLDELLRARLAPGLALAVRQKPVEAGAHQHHDVGILQHHRARGTRRLRMRVRQKALGHAHLQERNAALLDQSADLLIGLRVGRTFAEHDQGALGALQQVERARRSRSGREAGPAPGR